MLFLVPLALAGADLASEALGVLERHCVSCHGARKAAGLDLRSRQAMIQGGSRGAAVVPFDPESSLLCQVVAGHEKPSMPPVDALSIREVGVLKDWVEAGAPWPDSTVRLTSHERPLTAADRRHWAFVKPQRQKVSLEALLRRGGAPAEPRKLVRRLYLSVLGLPPTPEEMERSLAQPWTQVVDRALASPHYGERWAAHWLDVARYADSSGYEFDWDRPQAWRYRDWVTTAFNSGMPYNRFVREQLAGDELDEVTTDSRIAAGFLRLGAENNLKNDTTRLDELDDVVSTVMAAFQGLSIGCARCHDHKYDPISRQDYHRAQAVFFSLRPKDLPIARPDQLQAWLAANGACDAGAAPHRRTRAALERLYRPRVVERRIATLPEYMRQAWHTEIAKRTYGQQLTVRQIEKTLEVTEAELTAVMTAEDRTRYEDAGRALADIEHRRPAPLDTIFTIGEYGPEPLPSAMEPGPVRVLGGSFALRTPPPEAATTYRRRAFADWIASKGNPLTARVMVNRIWQHHFGRGLVPTENNFGRAGETPKDSALLDALAVEFMDSGWNIKAVERLILNSNAWRAADHPRRRLDAETIRDAMLSAAGMLDRTAGGPAVYPYIDPAILQLSSLRQWPGRSDADAATWRRSLYVFRKRSIRYPLFEAFDQPDAASSCARRNTSATAVQALALMNNGLVRLAASRMAAALKTEADPIGQAYQRALSRMPTPSERRAIVDAALPLEDLCQLLFSLNEFLYLE